MKSKLKLLYFIFPLLFVLLFFSCSNNIPLNNNDYLVAHYFDVGQGDSTLIQVNGKNILIDSGSRTAENKIIKYLNDLNIKKIDYLISTHPHEDHIGNMDEIIDLFEIEKFYAPKVTTNTTSFEKMIKALKRKNLKINILKDGTTSIDLGKNTKVSVFSPKENLKDKNLNNYSPIIKIQFKDTSFLFTGDAEKENINYVLSKNYPIDSDVLKLGHHGSKTSTTKEFLEKVTPYIAIASLGENNSYGHPHKKVIDLLNSYNIKLFRTDKDSTITLISNGIEIKKLK
ncbi:ComEC/Rec2 family competence protein [uncultured Clostridium sp.]|uniref:ComEC/Rec2 family competence protein n=1 Tax=uncultured Clostridium sp. TaxID=59620 RepID=UPI00258CA269|nr:ComEC/Rec2 family competence protein [uncultured Clostridium sp.]